MKRERGLVVLVEDDMSMREAVERVLSATGFVVTSFDCAESALEERTTLDARCVVLDVHLPGISGFELYEHVAVRPGSEEYLDSEKYQLRPRDWTAAEAEKRTLAPFITQLNQIRRDNPALQQLRNLRFHGTESDQIIAYSKMAKDGSDPIIVVVNLDPHGARESVVNLDLPALGLAWSDTFSVHDLLTGNTWPWGQRNYIRLDPFATPAHILAVRKSAP